MMAGLKHQHVDALAAHPRKLLASVKALLGDAVELEDVAWRGREVLR